MESVLLVIHLIIALSIIALVLLQPSESGGFLGSGSMSNIATPRRSADTLTRLTSILVGCFFLTSILLAIAAGNRPQAAGILDIPTEIPAATVPAVDADATPKAPLAR